MNLTGLRIELASIATAYRLRPRPMTSRRSRFLGRAAVLALAGGTTAVAGTGVGYAYWTSTGHGTGSATTGTISLTADDANVSGLYPDGSVPVSFTVTNTSDSGSLDITAVTAGTVTTPAGGCTASTVSFAPDAPLPTDIAASGGTAIVSGTASMTTAAENACQGATFTIPLTVTGRLG